MTYRECLASLVLTFIIAGCGGGSEAIRPDRIPERETPNRTDIQLINLTSMNSTADDFGLSVGLDSSIIYFTSSRIGARGVHSIFVTNSLSDVANEPTLAVEINSTESTGMPSIIPGGSKLYFTSCNRGFGDCDIYVVESGVRGKVPTSKTPWTIPRNAGLGVNGTYWDSQPSISSDGSILLFSSDRPGGYGGRDIWYALRDQDGSWTSPFNAGREINTVFDEVTPWIAPDKRTLYFSSNGRIGLGGYDIYSIGLDSVARFHIASESEGLGRPINSTSDEISFSLSSNGEQAFIASNRSGGRGGYDLYQLSSPPIASIQLDVIIGSVTDPDGSPILADITVRDIWTGNVISYARSSGDNGAYHIALCHGASYAITASSPGRLFDTKLVDLSGRSSGPKSHSLRHVLQPTSGTIRLLLFFNTGSAALERESIVDLENLLSLLRENPESVIEVNGHTDDTGEPEFNVRLSYDRADAVKSWLVGNRVVSDRIEVNGFGATRPLAENSTEVGREMNRRVVVKITSP